MKNSHVGQSISLRRAEPDDDDLMLALYASTRAEEMALVPWTETQKNQFLRMQFEAQRDHYQRTNPEGELYVVLSGGQAAGRLWLARKPDEIKILDVTILPALRNAGIGGHLLRTLLTEAAQTRKKVTVYVEHFNPSIKFFERLGFVAGETQGIHTLMTWTGEKTNNDL